MRGRQGWSIGAGLLAAGACAVAVGATRAGGAAAVAAPGAIVKIGADVAIVSSRLDDKGANVTRRVPPPMAFHWERARTNGVWKTITTVTTPPRPLVHTAAGVRATEFPGVRRIEDDGDGTPARAYDERGQRLSLPDPVALQALLTGAPSGGGRGSAPATRPRFTQSDWLDGFVLTPDRLSARKSALAHGFGAAKGKVRGLDRFATRNGEVTTEVLADSVSGARMEMNVLRGNALETHQTFGYTPRVDGLTVLRTIHIERPSQIQANGLEVTDVTFSHVTINGQEGVR